MDPSGMLVFVRVVQSGSFSAAARALALPKSTVSRRVSELEARLGARLLQRTTRKIGLTDAGRVYYAHAARIAQEIEEAEDAVAHMQSAPRGLLRVTGPLSFGMLGPIVCEYLRAHPDARVELYATDRTVDLVEERFDVAIRAGVLGDSTLVARALGAIERVLVAAPRYTKAHGTPKTPGDLASHACIAFGAGASAEVWALSSDGGQASVRVTPRLVVNELEIMRDAALSGAGIAWIPGFACADDIASGRLRRVLPAWRSAPTPVHAVYPTARHLSPKVTAFVELVRERLSLRA